jgi:hypothetical protein
LKDRRGGGWVYVCVPSVHAINGDRCGAATAGGVVTARSGAGGREGRAVPSRRAPPSPSVPLRPTRWHGYRPACAVWGARAYLIPESERPCPLTTHGGSMTDGPSRNLCSGRRPLLRLPGWWPVKNRSVRPGAPAGHHLNPLPIEDAWVTRASSLPLAGHLSTDPLSKPHGFARVTCNNERAVITKNWTHDRHAGTRSDRELIRIE